MITCDELLEVFKSRVSCRNFTNEAVNEEDIQKIVNAGLRTASAHNDQSAKIIRISDKTIREFLRIKTSKIMVGHENFDPFYGAKELFLIVANGGCAPYDGSLTIGNMMLAATSLGLGSCWINTAQFESKLEHSLIQYICSDIGLSNDYEGVGYFILGHIKINSKIQERKPNRYFEI